MNSSCDDQHPEPTAEQQPRPVLRTAQTLDLLVHRVRHAVRVVRRRVRCSLPVPGARKRAETQPLEHACRERPFNLPVADVARRRHGVGHKRTGADQQPTRHDEGDAATLHREATVRGASAWRSSSSCGIPLLTLTAPPLTITVTGTNDAPVVSPDVGGVVRARALAKRINVPIAICDKRRERAGESEVMNVIGEVAGHTCILVDDIVDSGGTLVNAADALIANGAKEVYAYITHGVLSGGAAARIVSSKLKELVITDSILPTDAVNKAANIRTLSIAPLIAEAISRTASEESVSSLFD